MACVCGDVHCKSCGPGQGDCHCSNCGPGTINLEGNGETPVTVNPVTGCQCAPEQMVDSAEPERGRDKQEIALARRTAALHKKYGDWWWEKAPSQDDAEFGIA
jgi:hypothetical protein